MSHYSEFYDAIDNIAEHLRTDFIGPVDDNEILKMELEYMLEVQMKGRM